MLLRYRGQHKLRSRAAVAKNPNRKDRKGKDRKGEAATETSELGTTKSLDLLRASAESWYDGVYVNIRRRYSGGLTLLANYTRSKDLSNAPDFRSPMFESSVPQNNDLAAEKGPACDVRHRFALSASSRQILNHKDSEEEPQRAQRAQRFPESEKWHV
jgi:hypothetical protein